MEANRLYEFGVFRLDTNNGQLFAGKESVKIAPKVLECLILLVKGNGRIISKVEFFDEVWEDSFVEDGSLSYTISQLRKVLAEYDSQTNYIETIPRRGFRFQSAVKNIVYQIQNENLVLERQTVQEIWIEETEETPSTLTQKLLPAPDRFATKYFIVAALLLAIFTAAAIVRYFQTSTPTDEIKTIAVLPLKDLDGGEQTKPLVIGLTEALIVQLGKSDKIIVRPLRSVMKFAETENDPIIVGRNLSVDAVIVWNLQKTGERLRITARLLSVSDGKQSWYEVFEENESDIFKIQDAVSTRAANSLFAKLNDRELRKIRQRSSENNEAYEAYLRGRYHWNKRDSEGFTKARSFFEQAVTLDPKFADAHAGLADVHLGFYDYGYKKADETIPQAMNAVNTALKLNPSLSDAYSTLGSIEFLYNKNFQKTEENFKKAIELSPNDPTPRLRYGWMLSVAGRFEEGLKELETAEKLDPTSRIGQTNLAYNFLVSRRFTEAEAKLLEIIESNSDFSLPYWYLGTLYFEQGKRQQSLEQYFKAFELDEGKSELIGKIKELRKTKTEAEILRFWREELEKRYAENYFPPTNIALVAALAKDRERTVYWLKESEKIKDPWLLQIVYDGEYGFLSDDMEFRDILKGLKFE